MQNKKLCVIGDPIEHSKSPIIHNTMIKAMNLPYVYDYNKVAAGDIKKWIETAKRENYVGFNATMPHKVDIIPFVDVMDDEAKLYEAVNTVCFRDDKIYGFNTDGIGFLYSLLEKGVEVGEKTVTVIGAGGAASAVALKMVKEGAMKVNVLNRNIEKAESLCARFKDKMQAFAFTNQNLNLLAKDTDILINGTSLGMGGVDRDFEDLSFLSALPKTAIVCDLIYYPEKTKLLSRAQELNLNTLGGIGMLLYQGIYALEYMTGTKLDFNKMASLVKNELAKLF